MPTSNKNKNISSIVVCLDISFLLTCCLMKVFIKQQLTVISFCGVYNDAHYITLAVPTTSFALKLKFISFLSRQFCFYWW